MTTPIAASLEYLSPDVQKIKDKLEQFVETHCLPAEAEYERHMEGRIGANRWTMDAIPPCIDRLKAGAFLLFMNHPCHFNDGNALTHISCGNTFEILFQFKILE